MAINRYKPALIRMVFYIEEFERNIVFVKVSRANFGPELSCGYPLLGAGYPGQGISPKIFPVLSLPSVCSFGSWFLCFTY